MGGISRRYFCGLAVGLASIPADFSPNSAAAASVRTVRLGDGTLVPALGQGSWHLGQMRHPIEAEEEAMRVGISLGLTLIDTAEVYGNGLAEEMIGRVITGQRDHVREPFDQACADLTIATGRRTIATGHRYRSDNWRSATEARAGIAIATGHRAQSGGTTIATGHQYQSDNCRAAGEARAGITTGHRSDGITITIATGHRYQSDNWRWAGEASQRGHVNARSGCDR